MKWEDIEVGKRYYTRGSCSSVRARKVLELFHDNDGPKAIMDETYDEFITIVSLDRVLARAPDPWWMFW